MSSGKLDLRALKELLGDGREPWPRRSRPCWRCAATPMPTSQAIVTPDGRITYAELDEASAAVAARLVADGVVKGDRVALLAPNGIEWAVSRTPSCGSGPCWCR